MPKMMAGQWVNSWLFSPLDSGACPCDWACPRVLGYRAPAYQIVKPQNVCDRRKFRGYQLQFYYFIAGETEAQREEGLSQSLTGGFEAGLGLELDSDHPKVRAHVVYPQWVPPSLYPCLFA